MDFKFSETDEAFRREFRSWLEANLPKDHRRNEFPYEFMSGESGEEWKRRLDWHRKMHAGGWIAIGWAKEYGGRAAPLTQQVIYHEELERVGAPNTVNGQGIGLVGPTLMHWGTEEQRQRYLAKMLSAEEIWCQGYSEPNAGSDLASLRTSAVEEGDYFVVNGQKIWTSDAHHADMCFLLARTDPNAPKHKGISYLLVDMHSSGITVRPLIQMTGDSGFNEVFFEDVKVPKKNVVGGVNHGWLVALTSLMYERRGRDLTQNVHDLVRLAKTIKHGGHCAWEDKSVRQTLSEFACEAAALRYTALRQLTRRLKGLAPGPESSIMKLATSELNVRMNKFAMELLGPYSPLQFEAPFAIDRGKWLYRMLAARGMTLGAGSSEIQRNIIGERVLGLPKG